MPRGGKRDGAGRPPRATPKKAVTIKFEPEVAERLKALCEARGKTLEGQITEWVNEAKS